MINLESFIQIVLIIIAVLFIIILVVKRFLYFRPSFEFMYPQTNFEEIMEGNVHAWYLKGNNNMVILFCHGNAGNISHRQDKIMALHNLGFSVLIFDYTGFGRSTGVPNEDKCYHNASMFADILIKQYGRENMIMYGESLGAAVASYVALKYRIPILIIESGLPSIKHYIKSRLRLLGIIGFMFNDFNTVDYIRTYTGRLLVLHCRNDEIITWDSTEDMRSMADRVIEMNGSHNNPQIPWQEIYNFVSKSKE